MSPLEIILSCINGRSRLAVGSLSQHKIPIQHLTLSLALVLFVIACGDKPGKPQKGPKPKANTKTPQVNNDPENGEFTIEEALAGLKGSRLEVAIQTSMGDIECELFPELAPNTTANFVGLARGLRPYFNDTTKEWVKKPFYDGLTFHRVLPGFMIQGGDPLGLGTGGPGYTIKDELASKLIFDKPGRLAMAHTPYPDSAGSQFFITEGIAPDLNGEYAIFGQCNEGLDIVRAIARVEKTGNPERGRPANEVFIKHIEITYK
jgi:peptidyl-prolyl cis-trans isomerase A (cyclophilin A)